MILVAHGGTCHEPISRRMLQNHWNHGRVIVVWLMLLIVTDSDSDFDDVPTTCTSCDSEMDFTDNVTTTANNAVQTNSRFHVLADPVVLCSVCSSWGIHVGQQHICIICDKPVHAWCSNHE